MQTETTGLKQQDRQDPQTVYCLSIDLVGSTEKGLSFHSWEADRFNRALIEQIRPHLEALQLEHAVLKFTGDGWLIMSPTAVSQLCCLAIIFRESFQQEMAKLSKLPLDKIPQIRATLCSGRDLEVISPKGQKDYVGDSARRAARASALCKASEVLVDTAVRGWILRDFNFETTDVSAERPLPPKWEENIALYVLTGLKVGLQESGAAPSMFVYTLGKIGKSAEAIAAVVSVAERFEVVEDAQSIVECYPGGPPKAQSPAIQPAKPLRPVIPASEWNRVLDSLPDYSAARALVQAFREKHIPRDVATYTILVKKAPDIPEAQKVLRLMVEDGVWPNAVTYNKLVNKAKDYAEATRLVAEMKAAGIAPNFVTYTSLFSKDCSKESAHEILKWYYEQPYHPSHVLNALIGSFRRCGRVDDALEIALQHPHLTSAQCLMRDFPDKALGKFTQAKTSTINHPTADFALGALYRLKGDGERAKRHLEQALVAASHPKQRESIAKWLSELEQG